MYSKILKIHTLILKKNIQIHCQFMSVIRTENTTEVSIFLKNHTMGNLYFD